MNILDKIVEYKYQEVNEQKLKVPITFFADKKDSVQISLDEKKIKELLYSGTFFFQTITQPNIGNIGLIAEIKLKSPSAGVLGSLDAVISKVKEYEKAGADAISVVTDEKFFGGSLELFDTIKETVNIPVFRKDFIIDEYQLYESAQHKADAVLLIARILDNKKLEWFVQLSYKMGMEPVVEIYDEQDLEKAVRSNAQMIAVNARDLQNFDVNIEMAAKLGSMIPKNKVFVGFSGVNTREDVEMYLKSDAKAVLVGTSLMKDSEPGKRMRSLKGME